MLDPVSVAGLALGVFDQLLKLGAKTKEHITEMRSFDEIYGDGSLIQKFDLDAQEQIHNYLDELHTLLERTLKILKRVIEPAKALGSGYLDLVSSSSEKMRSTEPARAQSKTAIQLMKWSFRDKKDLATLVAKFTEVNDRLSEMIRFWSLASDIGVDLRHLQHLRSDEDAATLGCREDASLALAVSDGSHISENFELSDSWHNALGESKIIEDHFGVVKFKGGHVLHESCLDIPREDGDLDPQSRNRINSLAELLHQPKEPLYCILTCEGWSFLPGSRRISYIFNISPYLNPEPKSLVHESIRSENILFFSRNRNSVEDATKLPAQDGIDLKQPWIFGFEFSRPDTFFSQGFVDTCPKRDVYRHPERQGLPVTTFKKIHDIYALGVVLLEIGIWRPAICLERHQFARAKDSQGRPYGITQHLIRHAQKHLENLMGKKYRDIVLKCLTSQFEVLDDNREDLKLQRAFRTQVLEPLQKIAENI